MTSSLLAGPGDCLPLLTAELDRGLGGLPASQRPRRLSLPPSAVDFRTGVEAVELARAYGVDLDPWQQLCLLAIFAETVAGRWAAFESALLVARQNGKGEVFLAWHLAHLFLLPSRLVLHTAHQFKTAEESFLRLKGVIDGSDELSRRVRRMPNSHSDVGVELVNGDRLKFIARSRTSGRGFSGDALGADEAQELPTRDVSAILPTMSARPNPQVLYAGTVPGPLDNGEHFTALRDRGRAEGDVAARDVHLAWLEWSAGDRWADVDLDDRQAWRDANPAERVTLAAIERERAAMTADPRGFGRERLSIWPSSVAGGVVDEAVWDLLADPGSAIVGPVGLAVHTAPDLGSTSIGAAGVRADGRMHVELVEQRPGILWAPGRLAEVVAGVKLAGPVLLDPAGPAGSMVPRLQALGVEVRAVSLREHAQACSGWLADFEAQELRHLAQPLLSAAALSAGRRKVGDLWLWADDGSTDLTPQVATTLARQAFLAGTAAPVKAPKTTVSTTFYSWR